MKQPNLENAVMIRKARLAHGMSSSDLAANLGVTRQAVTLWERGGNISAQNTAMIEDLLEIKLN